LGSGCVPSQNPCCLSLPHALTNFKTQTVLSGQALETAYTRVLAKQLASKGIMVNCCWCVRCLGGSAACQIDPSPLLTP